MNSICNCALHAKRHPCKGSEVPAVKLQHSFASDRNMLIAFLR